MKLDRKATLLYRVNKYIEKKIICFVKEIVVNNSWSRAIITTRTKREKGFLPYTERFDVLSSFTKIKDEYTAWDIGNTALLELEGKKVEDIYGPNLLNWPEEIVIARYFTFVAGHYFTKMSGDPLANTLDMGSKEGLIKLLTVLNINKKKTTSEEKEVFSNLFRI